MLNKCDKIYELENKKLNEIKNRILVTGGAGYIGSNILLELLNKNKKIITIDNFSNSKIKNLKSLKEKFHDNLKIIKADILDKKKLFKIFETNKIQTVIHLAALKSVSESFKKIYILRLIFKVL